MSSSQLGLVYVHLGVESQHPEVRKLVNGSLVEATARAPQLTDRVIREALTTFLTRGPTSQKATAGSLAEEHSQPWNKNSRLSTLLLSTVTFGEEVGSTLRENTIVELIILSHHNLICPYVVLFLYRPSHHFFTGGSDGQTWVELCQKAGVDPRAVVDKHFDKFMKLLLDATDVTSNVRSLFTSLPLHP